MKINQWLSHKRVYVIAEAGVNHNGNIDMAKQLIDQAVRAKADAIKFQTWKQNEIVGTFSPKVSYIKKSSDRHESMIDLLKRLCLPFKAFRELQLYSQKRGIQFLSTPDGAQSLNFLTDELSVPIIKVGSTEITHYQFLAKVATKRRPIILSTGMSSLGEVERALAAIRKVANVPVVLLHCTTEYPAPLEEVNVRAMVTLRNAFQVPVGLSDHSLGVEAAIAAVALGAVVIEKHFTLDKGLAGPDHRASLNPDEMCEFVASIRNTEKILGDGIKRMTSSELANVKGIRRSLVADRPLKKGTLLKRNMLNCKRPGTGLAPEYQDVIVGMRLTSDVDADQPLEWRHFKKGIP